jgi:hypothetical protein
MFILDRKVKFLWNWEIGLVKVQWTCYRPEDATWEHENFDCKCVDNVLSTLHK